MNLIIRTKTLDEFRAVSNYAYKNGITSITNQKLPDKFWNDSKEDTFILIDDDTMYYGKIKSSMQYINPEDFLKLKFDNDKTKSRK